MWAVVTGGARRLGKEIALALAREGYNIILTYKSSQTDALKTANELRSCGVKVEVVRADLTAEIDSIIKRMRKLKPTVLVNNASDFSVSKLSDVKSKDIEASFKLHIVAPFLLSVELKRCVESEGGEGVVVNITDAVDFRKDRVAYHMGKNSLQALTLFWARLFAPSVRVNAVAPGPVLPPEGGGKIEKVVRKTPLKKRVLPSAVADAVLFLVKNEFVTGQVIFVDSGLHLV